MTALGFALVFIAALIGIVTASLPYAGLAVILCAVGLWMIGRNLGVG